VELAEDQAPGPGREQPSTAEVGKAGFRWGEGTVEGEVAREFDDAAVGEGEGQEGVARTDLPEESCIVEDSWLGFVRGNRGDMGEGVGRPREVAEEPGVPRGEGGEVVPGAGVLNLSVRVLVGIGSRKNSAAERRSVESSARVSTVRPAARAATIDALRRVSPARGSSKRKTVSRFTETSTSPLAGEVSTMRAAWVASRNSRKKLARSPAVTTTRRRVPMVSGVPGTGVQMAFRPISGDSWSAGFSGVTGHSRRNRPSGRVSTSRVWALVDKGRARRIPATNVERRRDKG